MQQPEPQHYNKKKYLNKFFTNKYLTPTLPEFKKLYNSIYNELINKKIELVNYETLIKFNNIPSENNIIKNIERYNKLTKKLNNFIKHINNQLSELVIKKKKYTYNFKINPITKNEYSALITQNEWKICENSGNEQSPRPCRLGKCFA